MSKIILSLIQNNDIEIPSSFKRVCDEPKSLLAFIARYLFIELPSEVKSLFVISEKTPHGEDRSKIWIKTSFPYGIGKMIDGEWKMDYGLSGYPVGMPFIHSSISPLLEGMRELSNADITNYGLPPLSSSSSEKMYWYMIDKPDLT